MLSPIQIAACFVTLCVLVFNSVPAFAMSLAERKAMDLSHYVVNDPSAGYFDVETRQAFVSHRRDPVLMAAKQAQNLNISCRKILSMPVLNHKISLPGFYKDKPGWEVLAKPFHNFEDAVSRLGTAYFLTSDHYYSDCLLDMLLLWSKGKAFESFNTSSKYRQGWYQVESSLFAAALALSVVQDAYESRSSDFTEVKNWLVRAARNHAAIDGGLENSCCNNHFYRRALYGAVIGILASDDLLFQFGVSAIYSAVSDTSPDGALKLEMTRGPLAAHYQNYAVMYLVLIAELMERQGYSAYGIEHDGRTLHDIVNYNALVLNDPDYVKAASKSDQVHVYYVQDAQFFSWIEIYQSRFNNSTLERFVAPHRPTYNRSLGGPLTLYFYTGPS